MSETSRVEILLVIIIGLLVALLVSINPQLKHVVSVASYVWIGICAIPIVIIGGLWLMLATNELAEPTKRKENGKRKNDNK